MVSGPLPYDIDTWLPVVAGDPGVALSVPLSASGSAAGVVTRSGAGAALTAPLTATAAAARARRSGPGGACTLPLTTPTAAGQAIGTYLSSSGTAILLPFNPASGQGRKRVSGQTGSLVVPLVDMQGNGRSIKQGGGTSCLLGIQLADVQANKVAVGRALDGDLRLSADQGSGTRREWTFLTPSDMDWQPFNSIYPNLLSYGIAYAVTVWQDAGGEWHQMRAPNPEMLSGALRIYEGGRLHGLSADDMAVLTDAGYGDNLVLQEMH